MAAVELHVVSGPAAGRRLAIARTITFGRRADAESLGNDTELSRTHARVAPRQDGSLEIEDLGSTNGTLVNGQPIRAPTVLRPGDRVELGASVLEVHAAPVIPPFGGFAEHAPAAAPERRGPRAGVVAGLMLVAAAVAAGVTLLLAGGKTTTRVVRAAHSPSFDGTVYLLSNRSQPDANSVLAYRYRRGSLAPVALREYPTGGAGSFDQSNRGVLDSVGQVTVDTAHRELFAVNESTDTIAAFHIAADGTLTPVKGSPFSSGGPAPATVAVRGRVLLVGNKALDGVREDLRATPGSYVSLPIRPDGSLGRPISTVPLPVHGAATQALVTRDGGLMIGSLETGQFVVLRIAPDGSLTQAPGSPQRLDTKRFPPSSPDGPFWPQGMILHPRLPLLYTNVPNPARLAVYSYDPAGALTFVTDVANKGSDLPCWIVVNRAGTRLYTDNAGNGTVSVFDIGADPRRPRQLQTLKLRTKGNPWNLKLDPSGRFLFVLNPRAVDFIDPGKGNTVHSLAVKPDGTLAELPSSPVAIPVSTDTQPQGLAVLAR